jgi:hypothetical protein
MSGGQVLRIRLYQFVAAVLLIAISPFVRATVFSNVHGVAHDPEHRPIARAEVTLKDADSDFTLHTTTGGDGVFELPRVPIGVYRLSITAPGFAISTQTLAVTSGTNPVLHIPLAVASTTQSVVVESSATPVDTAITSTLVTRAMIDQTPGAGRTLGMQMITDYVPGAYMTHDQLHVRGGHQTSWLIDGVSIPNTKIASNVGPQIDPKDIDSLETQRGSYGSELGDRTYAVFDVLPRNGFERDHEAELRLSVGNFYSAESQLSFGDHTDKTAWYTSLSGVRANYGLETPIPAVYHDATNSQSFFVSVIRNQTERDQIRIDGQYRQDYFQIPYNPSTTDYQTTSGYYSSYGLRDGQKERDAFMIANWVHTLSSKAEFSIAPFYHLNQANYDSHPSDFPVATTWHQHSNYVGGQADARMEVGWNSFSGGMYSFYQRENDLFGTIVNDGSSPSQPNTSGIANAGLLEFYVSDHARIGSYITVQAGERFSILRNGLNESAMYPRIGATVRIPRLNWVLRGYYGRAFQPAPVQTISSSVLNYAGSLGGGQDTFTSLKSERSEEHQFGIMIPYRGWMLNVDTFRSRINDVLDHANLGESNMYFPIGVDGGLVRAWEMTLRSPELGRLGHFHLAYSNQIAEQRGDVVGGFTCSLPGDDACSLGPEYRAVDHDQRHTLNMGFTANLPWRSWFATNVYYGSGFTNGLADSGVGPYDGAYLPAHTTFDASAGHTLGEHWKIAASIINVTNHRVLQDNSVTVGGFHWNDPRMISAELRYRFRF